MSGCSASKYEVIRGLWKGVAVPSIMYGMEALGYIPGELEGQEKTENRARRLGLVVNF